MDSKSENFICNSCGKLFSKKSYLNRHLKNIHKINAKGEKLPDSKFPCDLCDRQFKAKCSLKQHMNVIHLLGKTSNMFECSLCSYKTAYKCNLKKHQARHEKKPKTFICNQCKSSFRYKCNLVYHERKAHNVNTSKRTVSRKCPICPFVSMKTSRVEMNNHFINKHNIPLKWETLSFENLEQFQEWKDGMEKSTNTFFVTKEKSKRYLCHRNGGYKPKGKNIRHLKIMGSCKINAFCPSEIKVQQKSKRVDVKFLPCHVGHKNELRHVRLTYNEKKNIARKLLNKTPHDSILKEIRSSLRDYDLKRIHLINKKDLLNIEKSFNLNNETEKHPFDPISIETWVQDLKRNTETCILHYKPQGVECDENPWMKKDDFVLIFMTKAQSTILKTQGNDVICVDSTHGLNKYNFQLFTLLVMDVTREGFPVAFMFTNRSDEMVVSALFRKIKEKCGQIQPNAFMSDMDETLYTAWCKVMGPAKRRLFCSWHVMKAWRGNLNRIKNKEKREEVHKIIKTLMYELDKQSFHKMLEATKYKLKNDTETVEFHKYFQDNYIKNEKFQQWAYSYRINLGINTNMSLENFNRVLKYCYLRGKKIKRLDRTLCAILNLIKDKLFDWLIKIKKGKIVSKLRILRQRHKNSYDIAENCVIKIDTFTWQVFSKTGMEFYTVKKVNSPCSCQLQCVHCNSCFHEYICTCMDHAIKNNMCKHIHHIARCVRDNNDQLINLMTEKDDTLVIDTNYGEIENNVEQEILNEICVQDYDHDESDKNKLLEIYKQHLDFVFENSITREQVQYAVKTMKQLKSTIEAMASTSHRVIKDTPSTSSGNANVERQKRFFSTKQSLKQSLKSTLSTEERNKIAFDLLRLELPDNDDFET